MTISQSKREIIFDPETTGLDLGVDRVIEIGCVELINHIPSGKTFQVYINPQQSISMDSYRVHGLSEEFLAEKPVFSAVVDAFFGFIGDDVLIAHNAEFDLAFLNAELGRIGRPALSPSRVVDSLDLARRRHPAGPNSLDALCSRYGIDLSGRSVHGALIDASLLAEVYIELIGGRQASLALGQIEHQPLYAMAPARLSDRVRPAPLPSPLGAEALAAHQALVAGLKSGGIWQNYLAD
jgi:DNA polymerase-3 subunit epsilon